MKRVALTVASPALDEEVDPRFGRAPYIVLVDTDSMDWESLANPGRDASGGAGIRVAQILNDRGIHAVVSRDFGPKAQDALKHAGIVMHRCESGTTCREAIERLKAGDLPAVQGELQGQRFSRGRGRGRRGW